jgi:putative MATE family efflux protein
MLYYVIPLMLTNLIQQLYTIADNLVVGKFSSDPTALGAIGSSASVIAFLTALFSGFAVGTAATVSHDIGAKNNEAIEKDLHTSVILSVSVGLAVGLVGFVFARPILEAMSTKPEFIDSAVVYLQIRCLGMPLVSLYNIGAATLRSVGDSKAPLNILTVSGLSNVLLNIVFVLCFGMAADGVALATLASQIISVVLVFRVLINRKDEPYSFKLSSLKLDAKTAKRVLKFAIPGAIQTIGAHIMNIFIVSATNNIFDPEVIEARTIAGNIDTVLITVLNTYIDCTLTFAGQNKGANKPERIKKALILSLLQVCSIALVVGQIMILFKEPNNLEEKIA